MMQQEMKTFILFDSNIVWKIYDLRNVSTKILSENETTLAWLHTLDSMVVVYNLVMGLVNTHK